jgi:phosphoglycerate dehydrogenase-like enzyme
VSLVIASQLEPEFNAALAQLPFRPHIIPVPEGQPWAAAEQADVLIVRPGADWRAARDLPKPENLWPGRLRWVLSASAGIDFYPPWLLDAPLVTCGRGTASDEIADYVIAAIYLRAKDLDNVRVRSALEWRYQPLGRVIGSTVGIIGLGAIGQEVAKRAHALGAHVVAVRRGSAGALTPEGVQLLGSVEEVVAQADHIVIAVPATPQTRHLFNAELFSKVKEGAHLINIARGSVVDQEALIAALDRGRLDFATLDVTEPEPLPEGHPLYTHPRVRLTPHISSNYTVVRHRLLEKVTQDITLFAQGQTPSDVVDPLRGY